MNSVVYSLTTYDGNLIAGGAFSEAGGNPARSLAVWDGNSWNALGGGVGGVPDPRVFALAVYDGDLIAGGRFAEAGGGAASNIARWDGISWSPLGPGVEGTVYALTVYDGRLIAGGDFLHAGGMQVNCIAQWDGSSWGGLESGLGCDDCGNDFAVMALGVYRGVALIAGGWFNYAGGIPANYIASWTGEWTSLDEGMNYPVSAIIDYEGDLIAGGAFSQAGGQTATGIARWDGSSWSALGGGVVGWYNWVRALTNYEGELVAGGYFVEAGGEPANHIARWNGESWRPLDQGTDGSVAALTVQDRLLIVGGSFELAGVIEAQKIARWEGQARGACCLHAFCEWLSESECTGFGGTYEGDVTECDPNPCPTSSVEGDEYALGPLRLEVTPNPGAGAIRIAYNLPRTSYVTIEIFDATGALVRRMVEGARPQGHHATVWDRRGEGGVAVPSGVYLTRLIAGEEAVTRRAAIVR